MGKRAEERKDINGPSYAATYERARRLANLAMWTISLQRRRLKSHEPEDDQFLFRRWADFQFLIVALTRLRRAATLTANLPGLKTSIQNALKDFDSKLPMLKNMRDTAEHFDDYALDKGRNRSIKRGSLEVGAIGESDFEWLGYKLNADTAASAAQQLFKEIQQAKSLLILEAK
jgi:hypothetical protein